jgi:hypothetical protein
MKAAPENVAPKRVQEGDDPFDPGLYTRKEVEGGSEDELVMILMPKITWNEVEKLAKKTGVSTARVLSVALFEFAKRLEDR